MTSRDVISVIKAVLTTQKRELKKFALLPGSIVQIMAMHVHESYLHFLLSKPTNLPTLRMVHT